VTVLWWVLINYLSFALLALLGAIVWFHSWWAGILALYLLPPLLARLTVLVGGTPGRRESVPSKGSYVWWITTQLQVVFMRLPFLEEFLRMVPGLYSAWLRLWGARVGSLVFWSPAVLVADRPFVEIEDRAVLGYGCKVTAHLLQQGRGGEAFSLMFAIPKIGRGAVLGTMSGMGPGSTVEAGATLAATTALPPFHRVAGTDTYNPQGNVVPPIFILSHEES